MRATWTVTRPTIVMSRSEVRGSEPSSGSLPLINIHTISTWKSTVPVSTTASTARRAFTVSFPMVAIGCDSRYCGGTTAVRQLRVRPEETHFSVFVTTD